MNRTLKGTAIVALVVVVALAVCAPAFAWPFALPWWHPANDFTCAGKVKAIDTTNGRLVVRVQLASAGVAQYLAEDLTITVNPETQLLVRQGVGFRAIALEDIALEDHVRVVGAIDRSGPGVPDYIAKRVIVHHPVPAEGLTRFACRGPVVSVDAGGGGVVVRLRLVTRALWERLGSDFGLKVAGDAQIFSLEDGVRTALTLSDVVAGQRVLAQGTIERSDPDAPVFTVKWLRVFPAATPSPVAGSAR